MKFSSTDNNQRPFFQSNNLLHDYVQMQNRQGRLVLQPRMGFSDAIKMRQGLVSVRNADGATIGTITLDSYTRMCRFEDAAREMARGNQLNGYPIVSVSNEMNRALLAGVLGPEFPVQVRHGSPEPTEIFRAILNADIDSTEGGPISYCLPYGRSPLSESVEKWRKGCMFFAENLSRTGSAAHIETFGGCMMGQLCPPAMLVAVAVIESLFFIECGVQTISLSYTQGTNNIQDRGALFALRKLAETFLPTGIWHVVLYTFMGKFPMTSTGARMLIEESAQLAKITGTERLIVKTVAEAQHIPTIKDNIDALKYAHTAAQLVEDISDSSSNQYTEVIAQQARCIIEAVLELNGDLSKSICSAFAKGILDIPYCLHPDVQRAVTSWIDHEGVICWGDTGNVPIPRYLLSKMPSTLKNITSGELLRMLNYNQAKYDYQLNTHE